MLTESERAKHGDSVLTVRRTSGLAAVMLLIMCVAAAGSCRRQIAPAPVRARNVVLVTIDTLRADRLGAYGYARARTPVVDSLAQVGTRFDRAYATAPITLTSHASLLSGRYPPGHGARHNGIRVSGDVPLLADMLKKTGFSTGAFVGAFPLDKRFGLQRGFQVYGDRMPRVAGRLASERRGHAVVDEAITWVTGLQRGARYFLWVHLFEPHAPYGQPGDGRAVDLRYDDEVAEADAQLGRLLGALPARDETLVVVTSDHGEAFGEHGEIAHSIFVYDTTLRVPLIVAGPGVGRHVSNSAVSLVDVAPTIARLVQLPAIDADGIDLSPALEGRAVTPRLLYAESFAPLLDFGWSPLRSVREGRWKYVDAPRPELFDVAADPDERADRAGSQPAQVGAMRERVNRYSSDTLASGAAVDKDAMARLQALGYVGSGRGRTSARADPKDRRELAADIARIMSGELQGEALRRAVEAVLVQDPDNPQMNMRLGFVLADEGQCGKALPFFVKSMALGMPGADPHLGAARCLAAARLLDRAASELVAADRAEPDNPVVLANLGIVLSDRGLAGDAIGPLGRAVALDPEFHEARFNLAVAQARAGRPADAAREASELLRRLPPDAPQRPEVQRLLAAVERR